MNKRDLKTGMIMEFENGDKVIVMLGTAEGDVVVDNKMEYCNCNFKRLCNYWKLSNFSEDLSDTSGVHLGKIVKIYSQYGQVIWERPGKTIVKLDGVEYSESTLRSLIKKATNN